ncbi:MAG: cation diffusion facilitator family transporter [Deltaproteobacteria bacterium]|nr:cation diffusion facilitator family transporter [Deltaproteobacteria bacterium]
MQTNNDFNMSGAYSEYRELHRIITWLVATSLPVTTMVITLGILSGSLSIIAITMDYGLSLVLNIMSLITLGIILRQNAFKYPYGTGKLENFAGFLYGVCIIPLALTIIAAAVRRFIHPPETINFGIAMLFSIAVIRLAVFAVWITRLSKKYPVHSPLFRAYYVDYRAGLINESAIFCGLLLAFVVEKSGELGLAVIMDLAVAALIALYLLYNGISMIVRNVRSLMDLPLGEKSQYKILECLTQEFESYDGIGSIYTRMSGKTRMVQLELYFSENTTIMEIETLRRRMETKLKEHFGDLIFHLIPRGNGVRNG